jgi:plasmid stabilization system protein ParE
VHIHEYIVERSGSAITADRYIERIDGFLSSFDIFPERGALRNEVRPGLRIIGFERRVSVAFIIEDDDVIILRILAAGRELQTAE